MKTKEKSEVSSTGKPARAAPRSGTRKRSAPATRPPGEADARVAQWVAAHLEALPPRSKSLVVTVIGDSIAPHGGEIWMGSLIELLQPFNFNDRLVRTSVFRLTEEGMLESRREGRRALYTLTASGKKRFERAHRRIYMPPSQSWNGTWTLVMTPRSGNNEVDRVELRRELAWLGFATIGQGILAHPSTDVAALREVLESLELLDKVYVMQAHDLNYFGALPAREIVSQCWTLDGLAELYKDFWQRFKPMLDYFRLEPNPNPLQAFQVRTLVIHAYRRAILNDPQFPAEILPANWPGHEAYALCRDLYNLCCRPAEQHLASVLGIRTDRPPPAEPYYYLRFGGLVDG